MNDPQKICPRCQTPAGLHAVQCEGCGRKYRTQFPQNPDRTMLVAPEAPAYPVPYEPQSYPAHPLDPNYPGGELQAPAPAPQINQQVHIHMDAPAPPPSGPVFLYAARESEPCAVASAILGGLSLVFWCLFGWAFAVAGLVLGIVSLARLKSNPQLTGSAMAVIGIVLSSVTLMTWAFVLFVAASAPPAPT